MWNLILSQALNFVFGVIGLVLLAMAPKGIGWLRATIDNKKLAGALSLISARVAVAVAARAATVRDLKDPAKPGAGAWTREAAEEQVRGVIADVIAELPKQAAIIRKGLAAGRTLEDVLRTQTEAAVEELRHAQPVLLAAPLPAQLGAPITVNVTTLDGSNPDRIIAAVQEGIRASQRPQANEGADGGPIAPGTPLSPVQHGTIGGIAVQAGGLPVQEEDGRTTPVSSLTRGAEGADAGKGGVIR